MRLLVTRPEPDASRTAEALRARGHTVLVAPLLATLSIAAEFAGPYDAVLITSANAARALSAHPRAREVRRLPCFAVGDRTAEAARMAGLVDTVSADGALPDLVDLVAGKFDRSARLLYLAGEDRAGDLAADLARRGMTVDTAVVYQAVAAEKLPGHVVEALKQSGLDGVLHYSRRSAATLLRVAEATGALKALLDLAQYCLAEEVAAPLRKAGAARVSVAARPDEAALFGVLKG
jgi:uroporphyrinogen-III synthase